MFSAAPLTTRRHLIVALLFLLSATLFAADKPAANKTGTVVDQGSFGIFQNGQRIATETFTIRSLASRQSTWHRYPRSR
jgi:hypothetical protein